MVYKIPENYVIGSHIQYKLATAPLSIVAWINYSASPPTCLLITSNLVCPELNSCSCLPHTPSHADLFLLWSLLSPLVTTPYFSLFGLKFLVSSFFFSHVFLSLPENLVHATFKIHLVSSHFS